MITIRPQKQIVPLTEVCITTAKSNRIVVYDGSGTEYARSEGHELRFLAGGDLGSHFVAALDNKGNIVETKTFQVECQSDIVDNENWWKPFHDLLVWNLHHQEYHRNHLLDGHRVDVINGCPRNGSGVYHGAKFYFADLKGMVELFGATQREDGMIYDLRRKIDPECKFELYRYKYPGWTRITDNGHYALVRLAVEADVEHFWVDAFHTVWKSTGDDAWMAMWLDTAIKALHYSLTDPLRWSKKYQLIKRGYTIDTWDFMIAEERQKVGGSCMEILPDCTHFGVMHGDTTGTVLACMQLADMLEAAGRNDEAHRWRSLASTLLDRLDVLAWNGKYYRHWVPEDPSVTYDTGGVDPETQVSLSNALTLNRPIHKEKKRAILQTYKRIREELPSDDPAEFLGIYPPFRKGFGFRPWHYTNGGVFPFVGGELAFGAFSNGEESYGLDLLRRMKTLIERTHGEHPYYYLGHREQPPERSFTIVDISESANIDFGSGTESVVGWIGEGPENDMSVMPTGECEYHGIPTKVIDPAHNGYRGCIGIAPHEGYYDEIRVSIGSKASSVYIHHTLAGHAKIAGQMTVQYTDGEYVKQWILPRKHICSWWDPMDVPYNRNDGWQCRVTWKGQNKSCHVGACLWGWDNPYPEKVIDTMTFSHIGENGYWMILGLTLSDRPVFFPPPIAVFGTHQDWHAGSTLQALFEGLAGIDDTGTAMDRITLSPRWILDKRADKGITICARYPASRGYCMYSWECNRSENKVRSILTSSAKEILFRMMLPDGVRDAEIIVNGNKVHTTIETNNTSVYCITSLHIIGVVQIDISW